MLLMQTPSWALGKNLLKIRLKMPNILMQSLLQKRCDIEKAGELRWKIIKDLNADQGVDQLLTYTRCMANNTFHELICKLQFGNRNCCFIYNCLTLSHCGGQVVMVNLYKFCLVELVRCKCGSSNPHSTSKCAFRKFSCRAQNLACSLQITVKVVLTQTVAKM